MFPLRREGRGKRRHLSTPAASASLELKSTLKETVRNARISAKQAP